MVDDDTYEAACIRAELLGSAAPNKEEFEKARAERLQKQFEELEAAEGAQLEDQDETMKNIGGRLDELNTILSTTQKKLNRLKDTARGSFSSIFHRGSVDIHDAAGPSGSGAGSRRNTTASTGSSANYETLATAQQEYNDNDNDNDNDNSEIQPIIPTEKIRQAKVDIQKKMSSHLDKLDMLVNKAENAEMSMTEQTKQMRKMAE